MSDIPKGEAYKGPSGIARESTWLTSEDLPHDRDTIVEIEQVTIRRNLKMQGGREKPIGLSLKFRGKGRELLLNATNRAILGKLCGTNDTATWYGQRIALYVEQDIRRPDGTKGPAVRIRAKRMEQPVPAPVDNPMVDREPGADG